MASLWNIDNPVVFFYSKRDCTAYALDDCTMKKTLGFYVQVLIDVDLLSCLPQQFLVKRTGFAFIAYVEYKRLLPFFSFCKMIGHTLYACRHRLKVIGLINK